MAGALTPGAGGFVLIDLLVLIILAASAFHGWRKRFLPYLIVTLGTVAGYFGAFLLAPGLSGPLGSAFGLSPLLAPLAAGLAVFWGVTLVAGVAAWLVGRHRRRRVEAGEIPDRLAGKIGGAALGLVRGTILAMLVAWIAHAVSGLSPEPPEPATSSKIATAAVRGLTRTALGAGDETAPLAGIAADTVADPAGVARAVREITARPAARRLMRSREFARAVSAGDGKTAAFHPLLDEFLYDPEVQGIARERGWITDDFDTEDLKRALALRLMTLAPKLKAMREDPEVQQAMQDPEVRRMVESRNVPGLMNHPKVAPIIEKVLGELR